MPAVVSGVGSYLPAKRMSNDELSRLVDTSDEWIFSHTGIRYRHIASKDQNASDLGIRAAEVCLERSGVRPSDLDLILVATSTGDYRGFPSTACIIQEKLGAARAGAMDLAAACSGFVYGLETARAFVDGGAARNVLLIGTEVMSRILDWSDRGTCVLFGDGAGAVLISASDERTAQNGNGGQPRGIIGSILRSEGEGADALAVPFPNGQQNGHLSMDGRRVYNFAVRVIGSAIQEILERHGLGVDDLTAIVPHQANVRIIKAAAKRLRIPADRFFMNMDRVANTSAASIPIALDALLAERGLRPGEILLTVGFGGGLTYGANLIRW